MAPKRKTKEATAAKAVTLSPRRMRSGAVGKRVAPPVVPPALKTNKKIRFAVDEPAEKEKKVKRSNVKTNKSTGDVPTGEDGAKVIVIEACKQCNAFKTRAQQVKEGLEASIPRITVSINPEKPRRGCFEIREEGGELFISLLDMKRPFVPMKKLDMDEVIQEIIKKLE